jgi:hypothetical protein
MMAVEDEENHLSPTLGPVQPRRGPLLEDEPSSPVGPLHAADPFDMGWQMLSSHT